MSCKPSAFPRVALLLPVLFLFGVIATMRTTRSRLNKGFSLEDRLAGATQSYERTHRAGVVGGANGLPMKVPVPILIRRCARFGLRKGGVHRGVRRRTA